MGIRSFWLLFAFVTYPLWAANGSSPSSCERELAGLTLGAIQYDLLTMPALDKGLAKGIDQSLKNINAVANNPEAPTFANTILAIEHYTDSLDHHSTIFYSYLTMQRTPEIVELASKYLPQLADLDSSLILNDKLFERVQKVYSQRDQLNLRPLDRRLLEQIYRRFVKLGANLPAEKKERIKQISRRIIELNEKFKFNLMTSMGAYEMHVSRKLKLKGLPENLLTLIGRRANERQKSGFILTLGQAEVGLYLRFLENRSLRERIWRAYTSRAIEGELDNRPILIEIAALREENAKILGFDHHADFVTSDRMAKNLKTVDQFLDQLADVYKKHGFEELKELEQFAGHKLEPWDQAFYAEKLLKAKFDVDSEKLSAYFPLDQVLEGAFFAAHQLYGITFKPRTDLPKWDPSVRVFQVIDRDGSDLALFYFDPYSRPTKAAGAWATLLRLPGMFDGTMRRPHVVNVLNLTPPSDGKPTLLTQGEVTTLFHELGHGLHAMLTQVEHSSLAGMNTAWDFVELPSQIFENWAFQPEVLKVYARHYQTGEPLPADDIAKALKAQNFRLASLGVSQIYLSKLDLAWHGRDFSQFVKDPDDIFEYEEKVRSMFEDFPFGKSTRSTWFSHIFAGAYSAGYYSYKWAEVLAADAFEVFKKKGIFDQETAGKFRRFILERGGSEDSSELYRQFRGSDPDPDSLLRSQGLL